MEPTKYSGHDVFDVAEGYYLYLSEYHEGQWSDKYRYLSMLSKHFSPRMSLHGAESLTAGGRNVYAHHVDKEGGLSLYITVYGDGALLDASMEDSGGLLHDKACGECKSCIAGDGCDNNHTCTLELAGVPARIALAAIDYCNGNSGPEPYSDGYEAMECFSEAKTSTVLECEVPWEPTECDRLGGCFLCGGDHRG